MLDPKKREHEETRESHRRASTVTKKIQVSCFSYVTNDELNSQKILFACDEEFHAFDLQKKRKEKVPNKSLVKTIPVALCRKAHSVLSISRVYNCR